MLVRLCGGQFRVLSAWSLTQANRAFKRL
eukprot:COSAG06_NODE_17716_length_925_cov_0.928571_1_plen_28_part_10